MPELTESYWVVNHSPDLTETGLYMKRTYIRVKQSNFDRFGESIIDEWCHSRFGRVVQFVQGVYPTPGWKLHESMRSKFLEAQPIMWGGYPTTTRRVVVELVKRDSDSAPFTIVSDDESAGPLTSPPKEELAGKTVLRFDGPPGTEGPRFIESERDGKSISIGEWVQDGDDWLLVLHDDGRYESEDVDA